MDKTWSYPTNIYLWATRFTIISLNTEITMKTNIRLQPRNIPFQASVLQINKSKYLKCRLCQGQELILIRFTSDFKTLFALY